MSETTPETNPTNPTNPSQLIEPDSQEQYATDFGVDVASLAAWALPAHPHLRGAVETAIRAAMQAACTYTEEWIRNGTCTVDVKKKKETTDGHRPL